MFSDKSHSNHCHILRNHKWPLPGPEGPLQECSRLPLPVFRRCSQVCNPSAWPLGSGSPSQPCSPAPTFQPSHQPLGPRSLRCWEGGLQGFRWEAQLQASPHIPALSDWWGDKERASLGLRMKEDFSPSGLTLRWALPGVGDRCPLHSLHGHRNTTFHLQPC